MTTNAKQGVNKASLPAKPADDDILGKAYDARIVRRLAGYLRPYWRNVLAALVLMFVATVANVSGPWLVKVALDDGLARRDARVLGLAVLGYAVAALVMWLGTYWRIRIMAVTGQNVILDLRRIMFDHLQQLSLGFYSRYAVGRLISRMVNDVSVLREMIVWAMLAVVRHFADIFGIALAMFALN